MGFAVGVGKLEEIASEMAGWSVDQILDEFEARGLREAHDVISTTRTAAAKYGLKLLAYESGQHMVAMTSDRKLNDRLSELMIQANRSARMGAIYERYYDAWAAAGGDLLNVFASVGRWSVHGCWGLAEYFDQSPADIPKYAATLRWARKAGQPVADPGR